MDDKNNNIDEKIVRFIQGTSAEYETPQFFSWLNEKSENELSFFQMKEIFDSRKRISVSEKQQSKRIFSARCLNKLLNSSWMRYAAIIAIAFGVTFVWRFLQPKQTITPDVAVYVKQMAIHNTRGVYEVILPDGSNVWIHGTTTLRYPEQFADSIRQVDLQGEAYFEVQADERHPFVALTPTPKVRAAGTEFNITTYPNDTDLYTDWKDGVYRFKNESFQNIVLRLEKMYGVDIVIECENLKNAVFSGLFTTDYSLKEVFEIINISNPVSYTIKDKVVSIRNKMN